MESGGQNGGMSLKKGRQKRKRKGKIKELIVYRAAYTPGAVSLHNHSKKHKNHESRNCGIQTVIMKTVDITVKMITNILCITNCIRTK